MYSPYTVLSNFKLLNLKDFLICWIGILAIYNVCTGRHGHGGSGGEEGIW